MYSFPYLEPVCSMSSSNCCFLTYIEISQEAGQVAWYSHLLKNFPVFCDPHKVFGIVHKAKVDVFLELSCFFLQSSRCWKLVLWTSSFSISNWNIQKFFIDFCYSSVFSPRMLINFISKKNIISYVDPWHSSTFSGFSPFLKFMWWHQWPMSAMWPSVTHSFIMLPCPLKCVPALCLLPT